MGKKLESNFTNMVVVLFSVTLIASAAVGYVYSLTQARSSRQASQTSKCDPRGDSGESDNDPNADVWKARPLTAENWNFIRRRKTEN